MTKAVRWDAEGIKAEVRRRGKTLKALALENSLSESACRASLKRPQPTSDLVISQFLGVPLHQLGPTRYTETGERRIARHVRDENKRDRAAPHGQIAGAR
jgi:Ner family transcriptional regulator